MTSIASKSLIVEIDMTDWRYDVPQEGSETIVLTSYRAVEYCIFQKGSHVVSNRATRGKILTKYECVGWIYKHDLLKAMLKTTQ